MSGPLRGAATLVLAYGLAAITGYGRDFALAYKLGTTRAGDVFFVGYTAVDLIGAAIVPAIAAGVIPFLVQSAGISRQTQARQAASVVAVFGAVGSLGALAMFVFAPALASLLGPGVQEPEQTQLSLTIVLLSPAAGLLVLAGTMGAVLLSSHWTVGARQ
jgi:peptidoglycan biosynthesis protein MviN/MurJ (putative lipid II flippase)